MVVCWGLFPSPPAFDSDYRRPQASGLRVPGRTSLNSGNIAFWPYPHINYRGKYARSVYDRALSSTYVRLSTPLEINFGSENKPFVLQQVIDNIVPGILPLLAVFGIYWWLLKRNQNFTVIMLVIITVSIAGAFLGIF